MKPAASPGLPALNGDDLRLALAIAESGTLSGAAVALRMRGEVAAPQRRIGGRDQTDRATSA